MSVRLLLLWPAAEAALVWSSPGEAEHRSTGAPAPWCCWRAAEWAGTFGAEQLLVAGSLCLSPYQLFVVVS